jgi:phosphoglycolate phosphatase-like HAD superfamily hydrolase
MNQEKMKSELQIRNATDRTYGVIFDLDGTLVDTSGSFDETIKRMVFKYSNETLSTEELTSLRQEGGFNDDWVATSELLRRRNVSVPFKQIVEEATALYLHLAPQTETYLFEPSWVEKLKARHPIAIVTGRSRQEYTPVWASRLDPIFDKVYCVFDLPGKKSKPSPDYLLQAVEDLGLTDGVYVGNAVDDMWAARDAGLSSIGVTTTLSRKALEEAGAQLVLGSVNELEKLFEL